MNQVLQLHVISYMTATVTVLILCEKYLISELSTSQLTDHILTIYISSIKPNKFHHAYQEHIFAITVSILQLQHKNATLLRLPPL